MVYLCTINDNEDDRLSDKIIIRDKKNLDKILPDCKSIHTVIFRKDFTDKYFTIESFYNYLRDMLRINKNLLVKLEGTEEEVDGTDSVLLETIRGCTDYGDMINIIAKYRESAVNNIHRVIDKHLEYSNEQLEAASNVFNLITIIDDKDSEIEELNNKLESLLKEKNYYADRLDTLVGRINYQYNLGVDVNKLTKCNTNNYKKVLYFKEYTRVRFFDTFLMNLKVILESVSNTTVRICIIEPHYALAKVHTYKDMPVHYALTERDLVNKDILMLGVQHKVLDAIMRNIGRQDVLIILDRSYLPNMCLANKSNIEYFYVTSDINDIPNIEVPLSRIITSDNENTLTIDNIENFDEIEPHKKVQYYSKMDIVNKLKALVERGV